MLVSCELNEKKQPKDKKLKFFVDTIEYDGNKISKLVIVNQNGEELYKYPKSGNVKPSQNKPSTAPKTNEKAEMVKPLTRGTLLAEYGIENPEKTAVWLEGKFGKELKSFTPEETMQARAMLDKKKAEREAQKRLIDDADIPFPMGD
jgi:hypothetical protein